MNFWPCNKSNLFASGTSKLKKIYLFLCYPTLVASWAIQNSSEKHVCLQREHGKFEVHDRSAHALWFKVLTRENWVSRDYLIGPQISQRGGARCVLEADKLRKPQFARDPNSEEWGSLKLGENETSASSNFAVFPFLLILSHYTWTGKLCYEISHSDQFAERILQAMLWPSLYGLHGLVNSGLILIPQN